MPAVFDITCTKIADDVPGLPTIERKRDRLRILDFEDPEG
jgi:hypothetical protein